MTDDTKRFGKFMSCKISIEMEAGGTRDMHIQDVTYFESRAIAKAMARYYYRPVTLTTNTQTTEVEIVEPPK